MLKRQKELRKSEFFLSLERGKNGNYKKRWTYRRLE